MIMYLTPSCSWPFRIWLSHPATVGKLMKTYFDRRSLMATILLLSLSLTHSLFSLSLSLSLSPSNLSVLSICNIWFRTARRVDWNLARSLASRPDLAWFASQIRRTLCRGGKGRESGKKLQQNYWSCVTSKMYVTNISTTFSMSGLSKLDK